MDEELESWIYLDGPEPEAVREMLDLLREKARAGDRFLLCSDGLTRTVPESQIEALMEKAEIGTVVQELISATLAAGAPDNVTVLIAEAFADIA